MRQALAALALMLGSLLGGAAGAGETRCWLDNGVVVVPAALGDIAGDFILDISAPQSQLHLTTAQSDGIDGPAATARLELAGERAPATFAVADLDARGWGFPTNIAGVIGADVLGRYVVDLRLSPCRLTLWSGRAPRLRGSETLPLRLVDGVPSLEAVVTDGRTVLRGLFAIDTGSAGVRVSDAAAALSRAPPGLDPASRTQPPARLAGLGLGANAWADLAAALEPQTPAGLLGGLGTAVWSRYAEVRVDFRKRRLELVPRSPPSPSWGGKPMRSVGGWGRRKRQRAP